VTGQLRNKEREKMNDKIKRIICTLLLALLVLLIPACNTVTASGVQSNTASENENTSNISNGESDANDEVGDEADDEVGDEAGEEAGEEVDDEAGDEADDEAEPTSFFGKYGMLIALVGFVVIFYLIMILPERKRKKKLTEMRNSVTMGDEITTIEGIIGTIVIIDDDKVTIETGEEKVRIQIAKWAISTVSKPIKDT
jgi:preprotein translocase subunit YajC